MRIGIAFVFVSYYGLVANAAFQAGNAIALGVIAGSILTGVACFLVPLWGIHGRLTTEKGALIRGVNQRAQALQDSSTAEWTQRTSPGSRT